MHFMYFHFLRPTFFFFLGQVWEHAAPFIHRSTRYIMELRVRSPRIRCEDLYKKFFGYLPVRHR